MMTQEEALRVLKTGANVFLTGEPGSGKTHTVNAYVRWLRARGIEPAITASTGIAATHIGGLTIHSWSGIGIKQTLSVEDLDAITQKRHVVRRVATARVLIIDEVSMLSAETLAMVDAVCREVRRDPGPFGGLQVILVGDFFQLPPVSKRASGTGQEVHAELLSNREGQGALFACFSPAWQRARMLVCYLSEQHRQEDAVFLELLLALRRGDVSDSHRALLNSCRVEKNTVDELTELYSHNADVDALNTAALSKLSSTVHTFTMTSHGTDALVAPLKRGCLSPEVLLLKEGARVMFTKNDALRQQYVNGTLGIITDFENGTGYPIVETKDGRIVVAEPVEWQVEDGGRVLASITQVPLRLAWAITVHKSQGMSLDAAHMDLSNAFEYGQGYVALSRVRTLKGLSLVGFNARALEVNPDILEKDDEFRTLSDTVRCEFDQLSPKEVEAMHTNFVRACGGKEPSGEEKTKQVRHKSDAPIRGERLWQHTYALLVSGKSLEDVAGEEEKKVETLLEHLEKLSERKSVDVTALAHLAQGYESDVARAVRLFKKQDHAYLKPVFEALDGAVPYSTLRLARLLGRFPLPPPKEEKQKSK